MKTIKRGGTTQIDVGEILAASALGEKPWRNPIAIAVHDRSLYLRIIFLKLSEDLRMIGPEGGIDRDLPFLLCRLDSFLPVQLPSGLFRRSVFCGRGAEKTE